MTRYRFTEKAASRIGVGFALAYLAFATLGVTDPFYFGPAAVFGLTAGLFLGRVSEARDIRKGRGLIPSDDERGDA